jgi:hypothetical protein
LGDELWCFFGVEVVCFGEAFQAHEHHAGLVAVCEGVDGSIDLTIQPSQNADKEKICLY